MKKVDLKKLALMGIAGGLTLAGQAEAAPTKKSDNYYCGSKNISESSCSGKQGCGGDHNDDRNYKNSNQNKNHNNKNHDKQISESELLSQLNNEGKAKYYSLDAEGKALALKLSSQSCKGKNSCRGLNSCKGEKNSCAGKGTCAGTSPGPFTDKNTAVKVASEHMSTKRNHALDEE